MAVEKIAIRGGQVKVVGQPVGSLSDIDIPSADEKLNLQSISTNGPGLKATGSVAALLGKAPGAPAVVPIEISGTVSNPIVKPNTRSLVTQSATSLADKDVGGKTGDTVKGLLGGFGKKKQAQAIERLDLAVKFSPFGYENAPPDHLALASSS